MTSQRKQEDQSLIGDLGLANLLGDIKLEISMIYHLICSTLVNIEGTFNSYDFLGS